MPTRKVSERERLTLYARQATDEQLEEALEIISIERRIRAGSRPKAAPATKKAVKGASKRPAAKPADQPPAADSENSNEQQQ